jgi:very-short-patch-repair endonuclease
MTQTPRPAELLADRARSQHGVFTEADALACGLNHDEALRMVRQGWWKVIHPGVMVASGAPLTTAVREAAALLYYGPLSQLSHASAAARQRLEVVADRRVFVTLPIGCPYRPRPGVVVTRTRHPLTGSAVDGLRVTPVPRTVVDLARDLDRGALLKVVSDCVRRKVTTLERILAMAEGMGGKAGIALLRAVCAEVDPDLESTLEEEALPHMRAAGLEGLARQFEVFDEQRRFVARLDFADEQLRLAVEIDGWGYHSSPEARSRDSRRDRRLVALGWTVLRFTTEDVRRRPGVMVSELMAVVESLRARAAGAA